MCFELLYNFFNNYNKKEDYNKKKCVFCSSSVIQVSVLFVPIQYFINYRL